MRKTPLISGVVFLAVLALGSYWNYLNQTLFQKEQASLMRDILNSQASAIEQLLNQSLVTTALLAHEVRRSGGEPPDFAVRAAEILRDFPAVSSLRLAPAGVVSQIFPLTGNAAALGSSVFEQARTGVAAKQARQERRLTLDGPLQLREGGTGVIGYNPVFLASEDGSEAFWGFVAAVIDLDPLLSLMDLDALVQNGYYFELIRLSPSGVEFPVMAGGDRPAHENLQTLAVRVPNGQWRLRMGRNADEGPGGFWIGQLVSLVAALVFAWLVHYVLREPQRLRTLVESRTRELHQLAYHDFLTGLVNRRLLQEELVQALREQARSGGPLALLYLDLDDFKRINDSMGHEVGDQLLIAVAQRLRGLVRANDIVARLGGDEFAVVLLDSGGTEDILRLAEKLIASIRQPIKVECRELVISTSIGITVAPTDGDSASQLLRNADLALYASKRRGKNGIAFFNQQMQDEAMRLMRLEEDLRQALAGSQLTLAYQPIVELERRRPVACEALIRWQHPQHGWLAPGQFIAAAEQSGLIVPLGYWVLRQVCATLVACLEEGDVVIPVAVNISPQQFRDKGFMAEIRRILDATGVPPRLLELEITETTLMDNLEATAAILAELKALGLRISIDDFGTGYSSLALLKQLPVDKLKIDRCFVQDLETDEDDRQIIQAVVAMASKLDLEVVAEGIETEPQRDWLMAFGCGFGQGYLFGRPELGRRPVAPRLAKV